VCRSVFLDRHGAEHELTRVVARDAHCGEIHRRMGLDRQADQSQLADAPARRRFQAAVDVLQQHGSHLASHAVHRRSDLGWFGTRLHGDRSHTRNIRVAVDERQIAERIEQVESQVVGRPGHGPLRRLTRRPWRQRCSAPGHEIVLFRQRVGIGEVRLGPGLALREGDLGSQPRQRLFAVVAQSGIEHDEASPRQGVVPRRRKDHLGRVRNAACLKHAMGVSCHVPVDGLLIRAVGQGRPQAHVGHVVSIHVVPAGIDDASRPVNARRPLEHLEWRNLTDLLARAVHHVQRVHGHRTLRTTATADVAVGQCVVGIVTHIRLAALDLVPASRRQEHDLAAWQIPTIEIVVLAEGQLP
jgi:hypothetical protein